MFFIVVFILSRITPRECLLPWEDWNILVFLLLLIWILILISIVFQWNLFYNWNFWSFYRILENVFYSVMVMLCVCVYWVNEDGRENCLLLYEGVLCLLLLKESVVEGMLLLWLLCCWMFQSKINILNKINYFKIN